MHEFFVVVCLFVYSNQTLFQSNKQPQLITSVNMGQRLQTKLSPFTCHSNCYPAVYSYYIYRCWIFFFPFHTDKNKPQHLWCRLQASSVFVYIHPVTFLFQVANTALIEILVQTAAENHSNISTKLIVKKRGHILNQTCWKKKHSKHVDTV